MEHEHNQIVCWSNLVNQRAESASSTPNKFVDYQTVFELMLDSFHCPNLFPFNSSGFIHRHSSKVSKVETQYEKHPVQVPFNFSTQVKVLKEPKRQK